MSVLNQSGEEQVECPLCMEPLEVDDLNFFPCTCGYQICRFCWHRIRTDENGLCPACRKAYPENPADFKPLTQEEVARLKAEKRHKDQQRKQKITENRKHLANVRVVQRNLVFVVGLPMRLADSEVLKKHEYFGKFGKIHKVVINQSTSYAGSQGPSASAYVTYHKADDALRAIQAVNNIPVDGRTMKTSLGTTKYCSHFMKNQACPKPDCMYLHDLGDMEASFTKEEMQQGKHQEYEKKLHDQLLNTYNKDRKPTSSPPAVTPSVANCQNMGQPVTGCSGANNSNGGSSSCTQGSQSCNKEAWPSLQPGMPSTGGGTTSNPVPSTNGCSPGSKNETSQRKQTTSKNTNNHKKRHTSGEESRGKNKDKVHVPSDEPHQQHKVSAGGRSSNKVGVSKEIAGRGGTNNSFSSDGTGLTDSSEPECLETEAGGRLRRAATLFEPDNNSFFSSNSFTKVAATAAGSASTEWPPNGLTLAHMPDVLPPVHSSEDWQAAFGFSTSERPDTAPCSDGHQIPNSHSSPPTTQDPQQEQPPGNIPLYRHHPAYNGCSDGDEFAGYNGDTEGDDLGFDPFHETQKALAEMMETENEHRTNSHHHHGHHHHHSHHNHHNHHSGATGHSKLQSSLQLHNQQHILAQQHPRRLPPNVSGCTKLLDGLGIGPTNNSSLGPSTPARTRLPPPGFTTAPNHMNAFGLGIPRAPSNTGSKILPLINPSAANGDTTPTPGHPQQSMLFPPPGSTNHLSNHSYGGGMHNGGSALSKEWPENLRSLLSNGQAFPGPNTPSQNTVFHNTMHTNTQKGWSPVGPCSDWTALDPAIVSSSRPHSFHPSQHNPLLLHGGGHPPQHWLRSLSDEGCLLYGGPMVHTNNSSDWGVQSHNNPSSAPPPGFSVRGKPSPAPEMTPIESKPWSAGFAPIMNRDLVADL